MSHKNLVYERERLFVQAIFDRPHADAWKSTFSIESQREFYYKETDKWIVPSPLLAFEIE